MRTKIGQRKVMEETSFPMSVLKQSQINLSNWINQSESWLINLPIKVLDALKNKYFENNLSEVIANFRMLHEEFNLKLQLLKEHIEKQKVLELEKQQEILSSQVEQLKEQYLINNRLMEYLDRFFDIHCDCMEFVDKSSTVQNLQKQMRQLTFNVLLQIQNITDIGTKSIKNFKQLIANNENYEFHAKFQLYIEIQIIEIEQQLHILQSLKQYQIKAPDIVIQGHRQKVIYLSFSSNNTIMASVSYDRTVRLWKIQDQSILKIYSTDAWRTYFSPNGLFLVTMHDTQIKLWDLVNLSKDQPMIQLLGHQGPIQCLIISSNSKLIISGCKDKTIKVWNVENGCMIQEFQVFSPVRGVILTNNCNQVACNGDKYIRVWSLFTKAQLICQLAHEYGTGLDLSQNQKILISIGGGNLIKIWDFSKVSQQRHLSLLRKLNFGAQQLQYLEYYIYFSQDSQFLIIHGNHDKNIQIFHVATGKFIQSIIALGEDIEGVEINISRDLKFIAAGGKDMTIRIWENLNYLINIQN